MVPDPYRLDQLVVVVTGSTSGIGRAIAVELARAGAAVVVHGRRASAAEAVATELRSLGGTAAVQLADIADEGALAEFVDGCWNWQRRVDVWINNAGADVLTGDWPTKSWEQKLARLWQVDVLGTIRLSRLVGERMRSQGFGSILNIGWDQAEQGMAGDSGQMFSTIKGAIMAFTRSLAQSLAPAVRVNCLAPGWIRTSWGEQASDYWQQRAERESLLARWGTPEDVAQAARYLASPAAAFITGQTIPVNGGFRYGARE